MNTDIHRLLDEAFAGIEMTPAAQDLKEEIRANLAAQVDELVAARLRPPKPHGRPSPISAMCARSRRPFRRPCAPRLGGADRPQPGAAEARLRGAPCC
jgi:hypothetical protein